MWIKPNVRWQVIRLAIKLQIDDSYGVRKKRKDLGEIIVFDGTQRPWRRIVETNVSGVLFQTKGLYSGHTIFIS